MIYIKTDMTKMPKGCRWLEGSLIEACEVYNHCRKELKIYVCRNPFEPQRSQECPLIRKEDIK